MLRKAGFRYNLLLCLALCARAPPRPIFGSLIPSVTHTII